MINVSNYIDYDLQGVSYNQLLAVTIADRPTPLAVADLATIKAYCGITLDYIAEDAVISLIAEAAIDMVETYLNKSLVQREVTCTVNNGNGGAVLPYGPIGTVTVTYYDSANVVGNKLIEPIASDVSLSYLGGYVTIPSVIKTGYLQAVRYLYDNRDADNIGESAKNLLRPYSAI